MGLKDFLKPIIKSITPDVVIDFLSEHKGAILTGSTIIFNASGIAMTYRNSPKIHMIIESCHDALSTVPPEDKETKKKILSVTLRELAPLVSPIIIFFVASSACAIINEREHEAKIAALTAALTVAKTTLSEYDSFREEARKVLGDEKFKEIQDETAKTEARKQIAKNPNVINPGSGKEICYIPYFGKYFASTEDGIECAMLKVNQVLDPNRLGGKSYGHESRYGREIVTGEDLLLELGLDIKEIPDIARMVGWEAGRVDEINWNVIRDEMNGMSYLILNIHTAPCDITH